MKGLGKSLVLVHNFSDSPQLVAIRATRTGQDTWYNLLSGQAQSVNESGLHQITLEGYGYRWYRVGNNTTQVGK